MPAGDSGDVGVALAVVVGQETTRPDLFDALERTGVSVRRIEPERASSAVSSDLDGVLVLVEGDEGMEIAARLAAVGTASVLLLDTRERDSSSDIVVRSAVAFAQNLARAKRSRSDAAASPWHGVRVLLIGDDVSHTEPLLVELRRGGATVAVVDSEGRGLTGARGLDPQLVLYERQSMSAELRAKLREDPVLTWAAPIPFEFDDVATDSGVDLAVVSARAADWLAPERELAQAASQGKHVAEFSTMGPARALRALSSVEPSLRVTLTGAAGRAELDIANGMVLHAAWWQEDSEAKPHFTGLEALAACLCLDDGWIRCVRSGDEAAADLALPLGEAISAARSMTGTVSEDLPTVPHLPGWRRAGLHRGGSEAGAAAAPIRHVLFPTKRDREDPRERPTGRLPPAASLWDDDTETMAASKLTGVDRSKSEPSSVSLPLLRRARAPLPDLEPSETLADANHPRLRAFHEALRAERAVRAHDSERRSRDDWDVDSQSSTIVRAVSEIDQDHELSTGDWEPVPDVSSMEPSSEEHVAETARADDVAATSVLPFNDAGTVKARERHPAPPGERELELEDEPEHEREHEVFSLEAAAAKSAVPPHQGMISTFSLPAMPAGPPSRTKWVAAVAVVFALVGGVGAYASLVGRGGGTDLETRFGEAERAAAREVLADDPELSQAARSDEVSSPDPSGAADSEGPGDTEAETRGNGEVRLADDREAPSADIDAALESARGQLRSGMGPEDLASLAVSLQDASQARERSDALVGRARSVARNREDWGEVERLYQEACLVYPNNPDCAAGLAELYLATRRPELAAPWARRARSLRPSRESYRRLLARVRGVLRPSSRSSGTGASGAIGPPETTPEELSEPAEQDPIELAQASVTARVQPDVPARVAVEEDEPAEPESVPDVPPDDVAAGPVPIPVQQPEPPRSGPIPEDEAESDAPRVPRLPQRIEPESPAPPPSAPPE